MATGQILFQRFYYSKSFLKHDFEILSMAAIFLAAKIEEHPRRARDVVNVFRYLKQKRLGREILPMEYFCQAYLDLKAEIIKAERRILKELGFCVHVQHPHKMIISISNILNQSDCQELVQKAWLIFS
uniref:Cyclin-L1 (Trinotate prediction) n=1 Tax=Henneguya salminicola TaxID=69463 RepID=A0A6G3MHG4_HENSL